MCSCGHHHHGHDADEVFTSWGIETARKFTEDDLRARLSQLDDQELYGIVLRAKGIVPEQEFGSVKPESGLAEFRKGDGCFGHLLSDTEGNLMATEQAMLALCALERLPDGGCVYESKYREAA